MSSNATIDTLLVPEKTVVNAKGDGPALDISGAASRVFLLTLDITNIIEQEALDVSIFGSADGADMGNEGTDCISAEVLPGPASVAAGSDRACRREVYSCALGGQSLGTGHGDAHV